MATYQVQNTQKPLETKASVEKPQIDYVKRTKQLICGVSIV